MKVSHGKTFIDGSPDVGGTVYHSTNVETDHQRLNDPATGKPVILRHFSFQYPPGAKGQPTVEQILTDEYRKHLNDLLWLDDLELIQEPRVHFHAQGFIIFATCQPRKGRIIPSEFMQTLKPLENVIHESGNPK